MMPRSCNEDLRFREMKRKECLGSSIVLAAAALHMSPKTIQHCVIKCLSTEEVKAAQNFARPKIVHYASARGICNHGSSTYIKRILVMPQTTIRDCRVHFCSFFPTTFFEIAVCIESETSPPQTLCHHFSTISSTRLLQCFLRRRVINKRRKKDAKTRKYAILKYRLNTLGNVSCPPSCDVNLLFRALRDQFQKWKCSGLDNQFVMKIPPTCVPVPCVSEDVCPFLIKWYV